MADIYTFPTLPRATRDAPASAGVLVAMHHVDLDEVIETVLLLRHSRRTQPLLDGFNRGTRRLGVESRDAPS